jgi:hypothetical protein
MLDEIKTTFPKFTSLLPDADPEEILPGIGDEEIKELEQNFGCLLPDSYKVFLKGNRGLWLLGGTVQFGAQHPFLHDFPKLEELNPQQLAVVKQRGGNWPPPSNGMLCFVEYFLEDDGDQVLFKIDDGLINGEYPVYYYAHSATPASVRKVADSFREFLETKCLQLFDED